MKRTQGGFTLIELMISLVLFSFAVAGVLAVAVSMTQGYREQRQAVGTEASARVPLDFLSDVLRQAAPGVTDPTQIQDAVTCTTGGINVYNGSGTGSSDVLSVVYALGGVVTSTSALYLSGTTLSVVDASQLSIGDNILVSNLAQGHLFKITGKSTNTLTLASPCSGVTLPASGYPAGSLVIRAQHAVFSIGSVDGNPALMMDADEGSSTYTADPLADGVEDLQVAVGIDGSADGVTESSNGTSDEWYFNATGETLPSSGTWRAVRITLVARTSTQLNGGIGATIFNRPKIEDHAAGAADAYRRRVLRSMIEIRNTGVSP